MTRILYPLFFIFGFISFLNAQNDLNLALGEWKSYLPYQKSYHVTQSPTEVFYLSDESIIAFNKQDESFRFLSTLEGLSEVGVRTIAYNEEVEALLVCYDNSNMDLVKDNEVINLPFIKNATNVLGDKNIYDIHFEGDKAYLSCGFGLVKMNLAKEEVEYSVLMDIKVNTFTIYNNQFYAATEEGIYTASANSVNPADFEGQWEFVESSSGLPPGYFCDDLCAYNDKLYLSINDSLFSYDGNVFENIYSRDQHIINYITAEGDDLLVGLFCTTQEFCLGELLVIDESENFDFTQTCVFRPEHAIQDQTGTVWFADRYRGFRRAADLNGFCDERSVNSPFSNKTNEITIFEDEVWVASGGISISSQYLFWTEGFYSLQNNNWSVYNPARNSELEGLADFFSVAVHPENKTVYCSSFLDGLVEMDRDGNITIYNETNSSMVIGADAGRTRVTGLKFDDDNNLWVTNHFSNKPINVLWADGTWSGFTPPGNKNLFLKVEIDHFGNKWFVEDGSGIQIFNERDREVNGDEDYRFISKINTNIDAEKIKDVAVDLDGDVWVGTNKGAYVFECGADVFNEDCVGFHRITQTGGINALLLATEDVRCIAVDGANRKWFGTTNGVFVQSPNGEEAVAHFNTNNSPLFDNIITDIAIHPETGEVFIGTEKGMISYRGDAIEGSANNSINAYAFPNPVRPEYSGPIAIKGLARDADVKITDVNGQLVYETKALGGQAIWDGNDYNGRRANTGVYLVFSTNDNLSNINAIVTKIMFIN